jgi:hypothetical protein
MVACRCSRMVVALTVRLFCHFGPNSSQDRRTHFFSPRMTGPRDYGTTGLRDHGTRSSTTDEHRSTRIKESESVSIRVDPWFPVQFVLCYLCFLGVENREQKITRTKALMRLNKRQRRHRSIIRKKGIFLHQPNEGNEEPTEEFCHARGSIWRIGRRLRCLRFLL